MRVRVFGKDSDDKGSQLEQLTKRLLEKRGYQRITLNFVGAGGNELDIRAEYQAPVLESNVLFHLLGECKAYEATVNTSDWLKFLGKLYTEKIGKRTNVHGLFVALSGVNGNVAGAYEDFRKQDETVELVSGEQLVEQILGEYKVADLSVLTMRVSQMTADTVATISLGYYQNRAFWIVEFANATFTICLGESLAELPSSALVQIVASQIQAATYRDLTQEQVAKQRRSLARKYVLGQLLIDQALTGPTEKFSSPDILLVQSDIDEACASLQSEGKLDSADGAYRLPNIRTDLHARVAMIREILNGITIFPHIGTRQWEALVDDDLLNESLRIKDGLALPDADRPGILQLMKWSPAALLWALNADEVLCGHSQEPSEVKERMKVEHVRYYRSQMLNFAVNEFSGSPYAEILHERDGLRELEFTRRASFKSQARTELDMTVTDRIGVATFAPTGGLVRVWLVEDAPQPWAALTSKTMEVAQLERSHEEQ